MWGIRGRERVGSTRSHPEPGRDPMQRRRVLWGRLHGRRGRRGYPPSPGLCTLNYLGVTRGGAVAARWAHNPKVGGSNPSPATKPIAPEPAPQTYKLPPSATPPGLFLSPEKTQATQDVCTTPMLSKTPYPCRNQANTGRKQEKHELCILPMFP